MTIRDFEVAAFEVEATAVLRASELGEFVKDNAGCCALFRLGEADACPADPLAMGLVAFGAP